MSENQEETGPAKPPPPSVRTGPAKPPPPSLAGGSPSPSPPADPGLAPLKVKVKPGGGGGGDEAMRTGEPVVLLGTRVAAGLIDLGIALGVYIGVVIVMPGFLERTAGLLALAYIVLRDGLPFLNGQSVGKAAMKIRAMTLDGQSLSGNWQPAVIRNVVLLIPLFPLIELIVLLTREDKADQGRRLGDEWAKTKVVPAAAPGGNEEGDDNDEDGEGVEKGDAS